MNSRFLICSIAACLALPALSSCASLEPYDPNLEGAPRYSLSGLLRPGSAFICSDLELHFITYGIGDRVQANTTSARQPDGTTFVFVSGSHTITVPGSTEKTVNFQCAGWSDSAGRSAEVALPQREGQPVVDAARILPFANGSLLLGAGKPNTGYWWPAGASAASEIDLSGVPTAIGVRADKAGPITMTSNDAMTVSFQAWKVDGTPAIVADGAPLSFALPADTYVNGIELIEELSPGVFAIVDNDHGSLKYIRTDRPAPVSAVVPDSKLRSVARDPATGHLTLVGASVHDWDADGSGTLTTLTLPTLPDGFTPWVLSSSGTSVAERSEPNPNAKDLRIPIDYRVVFPENGSLVLREAPTTPCVDRDACRNVAEHYLIGAVQSGGQRYGVYYSWPWLEEFVRPLIVLAPLP